MLIAFNSVVRRPLRLAHVVLLGICLAGCSQPVEVGPADDPPPETSTPDEPSATGPAAPAESVVAPPSETPAPTATYDDPQAYDDAVAPAGDTPGPVASVEDLDGFFESAPPPQTADPDNRYASRGGGNNRDDAPPGETPLWQRGGDASAEADPAVNDYFGGLIGQEPPPSDAGSSPVAAGDDPAASDADPAADLFAPFLAGEAEPHDQPADDPSAPDEASAPAPDAESVEPLPGLNPEPTLLRDLPESAPDLAPLPEWKPTRSGHTGDPLAGLPMVDAPPAGAPAAEPAAQDPLEAAAPPGDPPAGMPLEAPQLPAADPTADVAEPSAPPDPPATRPGAPRDAGTPGEERLPAPPSAKRPAPRVQIDVQNTRQLAWVLGEKLSVTLAQRGATDAQQTDAWQTDAIAELLGVELLGSEADTVDGSGDPTRTATRLLKAAGQLGEQIALKHGQDHAALLEISVKSNALAALYEAHPKLAGPVATAIENAAGRSGLEASTFTPVVELLRSNPPVEQVREAVSELHATVNDRLGREG